MRLEGQSKDEKSKNLRFKPRKPLNQFFGSSVESVGKIGSFYSKMALKIIRTAIVADMG